MSEVYFVGMFRYRKQRYEYQRPAANLEILHKLIMNVIPCGFMGRGPDNVGIFKSSVNRLSRKLGLEMDFVKFIEVVYHSYVRSIYVP